MLKFPRCESSAADFSAATKEVEGLRGDDEEGERRRAHLLLFDEITPHFLRAEEENPEAAQLRLVGSEDEEAIDRLKSLTEHYSSDNLETAAGRIDWRDAADDEGRGRDSRRYFTPTFTTSSFVSSSSTFIII